MRHLPRRADEAYSPTRRPIWRFGFGDLSYECEGSLLICRRRRNRKTAVLWRLRAGDLQVCRLLVPGSPTCAQLPPYSFGDDLLAVSSN
jgi:hypothetical protein